VSEPPETAGIEILRAVAEDQGGELWQLEQEGWVTFEDGTAQRLPPGTWVVTKDDQILASCQRNTSALN